MKHKKFQIKEDNNVSLTNFFEELFLLPFKKDEIVKQFKRCFGVEVPEELRDKTERLFTKSWQFLLERDLEKNEEEIEQWKIEDLRGLIERNEKRFLVKLNDVIEEIERIHRESWDEFSEIRMDFIRILEEIIKKYGDFIIKEIAKKTKIPWQTKEIKIYPVFSVNNRTIVNSILLTFTRLGVNKIIPVVHELVHVNTHPIWKKYRENVSKNLGDAYEIATHIVTCLVIKGINKKFNEEFSTEFPFFEEKIKNRTKELENLCEINNFEEFIFKVQDFLNEIGYKSFFEYEDFGKDYAEVFKKK